MTNITAIPVHSANQKSPAQLGLVPLVALVVGLMIGGDIFSLPQAFDLDVFWQTPDTA